jgi:hypothetical protein
MTGKCTVWRFSGRRFDARERARLSGASARRPVQVTRRRVRSLALFPLAILLIVGWAAAAGAGGTQETAERPGSEDQVTIAQSDTLRLWLDVPEEVPVGEPVPITFHVENVSGRLLDLSLRGRTIVFDLVVSDMNGMTVWRRLHDTVIPAILRLETLAPGEVLELADSWDQRSNAGEPVPAGTYTVRGEILTERNPLVAPSQPLRILQTGLH